MANVLVVDDSSTMREIVSGYLNKNGFDVALATDGRDGLAQLKADPGIKLVVSDVNMPNMDGFGVISSIRSGTTNRTVPILVLTTESADHLKARARDAGATGWIVKPFDDETIVSIVRRVTGARV